MATTPARGTPEQIPAAAAVAETAAPVAPVSSSLPSQETAATDRATKANSPADVRALLSDLRKQKPAPVVEAPKPTATPAPAEVPAAEETPAEVAAAPEAGEETPATEQSKVKEEGEETDGGEEDDGGEGSITPITGKRTHLRLAEDDKVGRLAASFMRRNRDMPMAEAMAKAQKQLGVAPEKPAETNAAAAPKSDLPNSIEGVDKELERVESEREKALIDLRFEDVAKLDKSMRQLDRHRFTLERDGERNLAKQESDYNAAFSASETRASELYEFAGKPDSEGYKLMAQIDADLKENNDPLYASPDKPLRIAQMAAAELKIAPKRKGSAVAPAKAAAPVAATPAPKKQILPSGGSRTTPQVINPTTAVADEVGKITNVHQLRNYLKPLVKRR